MSKRTNTNDFFICSGGIMPAKMHTDQVVVKKANQTILYITHVDVKTTTMVDFSCKKLMLLAALVAVLVAAIIILTGGAASLLVAAAIGGAVGAAGGSLLCGWKAAAARKWIGYATQETLVIQGNYSLIDENKMICQLFNETIQIAPKITNWWEASLAGLSNFASEYFKCLMVGAGAAGIEVLATEGGMAFLANASRNYAWTWGKGLWLRGAMAVNSMVQDHYIQGKDVGVSTAKAAVLGGVIGPEVGTVTAAGNLTGISQAIGASDHNTWGQTQDEWNKADGIEGNPQQAQYHWLAKASSVSGAVGDLSAILGWGGVSAREQKALENIANKIKSPVFGQSKKSSGNAQGDAYSDSVTLRARRILQQAANSEPVVTEFLQAIAERTGARLEGLDFRLKTEESLIRKINTDGIDVPINDALRYTMILDKEGLTKGAQQAIKGLEAAGYKPIRIKNTFKDGAPYKGLNTTFEAPNGQVFELQFHTPESFNVKQNLTHGLYEELRLLKPDDPRAAEITQQLISISSTIEHPNNINDIP